MDNKIVKYSDWNQINEAAARMPTDVNYWLKRGKSNKDVALYTHDDMDGIYTALQMKKYLLDNGFNIVKYGILNYSDGWKYTTLDPKLINIVLDFANMPGDERDDLVDYYLDHHGDFSEAEKEKYKSKPVQKVHTASAYEAICLALGVTMDKLVLQSIDMIDSAKYTHYGISWQRLLDFNLSDIKKSKEIRLEFAAAFNQFLKRSDTKTIIAVIHNCSDASIYSIFHTMKLLYPEHNVDRSGIKKDFLVDSDWRLNQMQKRTRGKNTDKKQYNTFQEFLDEFQQNGLIKLDGYVLIGDLVFVPTGTWANALRARTIVERDYMDGKLPVLPKFILLQYGGTLQVCAYGNISKMEGLPMTKNGEVINDLGRYMNGLLDNFQEHLGYYEPDTTIGQDEITVSGGHGGIGSISNIFGKCKVGTFNGSRFIDMFKNKIIADLSGVKFKLDLKWSEASEGKQKPLAMDNKVMNVEDVTKMDRQGRIIKKKDNLNESNSDIWTQGFRNSKLFVFYTDNGYSLGSDKMYLTGCRNCNEVTPLKNLYKERQYVGNVYQSLANCSVCGNYIVYDEHNLDELDYYLKNKDSVNVEHSKNVKKGLVVNISYEKLETKLEPTEIIECEPFTVGSSYGGDRKKTVDTLYVYAVRSSTNDLFDNPLHNFMENKGWMDKYNRIYINLAKKSLYSPYPESEIDRRFPKQVADAFKRYINEYCK
jgi:hypothetical protein